MLHSLFRAVFFYFANELNQGSIHHLIFTIHKHELEDTNKIFNFQQF